MELSLFLAKFFGLYFMIFSLFIMLRKHLLKESVDNFFKNSGLILFSALFLISSGLLVVLVHPLWEMSWRVIITLIGYLLLFKGLLRLYFPSFGRDWSLKFVHTSASDYTGIVLLLLGIFLTYKGFA